MQLEPLPCGLSPPYLGNARSERDTTRENIQYGWGVYCSLDSCGIREEPSWESWARASRISQLLPLAFLPQVTHTNKENFMNQRRHTRAADCLCSLPFQKRIISFSARLRTFIRTFFAPAILLPNLLSLDLRSQFLDIAVSLLHPSPWSLPCHCTTVHTMSHHAGNQPLGFPVVMTRNKSSLLGLNISRSPSPRLGLANSCTVWRFIDYQLDYRPSQRWLGP